MPTTSRLLTKQQQFHFSRGFLAVDPERFVDFLRPFHGLLFTGTYSAPHGGRAQTDTAETIVPETGGFEVSKQKNGRDRILEWQTGWWTERYGGALSVNVETLCDGWRRRRSIVITVCNSRRDVNNVVITVHCVPRLTFLYVDTVHSPWPPPSFGCSRVGAL